MTGKMALWFLLFAGVTLALNIAGYAWLFNQTDIGAGHSNFNSPRFVEEHFGENVALAFPAVLTSLATVLGIFCNILLTHARSPAYKLTWRSFAPFLVSPIVVLGTYAMAPSHPDMLIAVLWSFQNGFFWQSFLGTLGNLSAESEKHT